jgi:nucleoid DNA-binding protein
MRYQFSSDTGGHDVTFERDDQGNITRVVTKGIFRQLEQTADNRDHVNLSLFGTFAADEMAAIKKRMEDTFPGKTTEVHFVDHGEVLTDLET